MKNFELFTLYLLRLLSVLCVKKLIGVWHFLTHPDLGLSASATLPCAQGRDFGSVQNHVNFPCSKVELWNEKSQYFQNGT